MISMIQGVLGLASGALVGFSLGLVGGGGSILAVPLMVYVVGVPNAHVAIGTSAIAVAANAAVNLSNHARGGTVVWSCALLFAAAGIVGAFAGSIFGKMMDGQRLLALFGLLMLVIAMLMLKTRTRIGLPDVKMSWANTPAILGLGLATGTLSGFFGIGGGFLIVPALMLATGMPIMNAVSSSLVAVTATSEELTAFMIGIPVASIRAGTIRKPPPMPKNPDSVPVARPRPMMAGMFDIEILTSASPIRDRVFSISMAITSMISANSASSFWPSTILPRIEPPKAPTIPAAANTSAQDQITVPPRAWLERLIAAFVATAMALVPIAIWGSGTPTT